MEPLSLQERVLALDLVAEWQRDLVDNVKIKTVAKGQYKNIPSKIWNTTECTRSDYPAWLINGIWTIADFDMYKNIDLKARYDGKSHVKAVCFRVPHPRLGQAFGSLARPVKPLLVQEDSKSPKKRLPESNELEDIFKTATSRDLLIAHPCFWIWTAGPIAIIIYCDQSGVPFKTYFKPFNARLVDVTTEQGHKVVQLMLDEIEAVCTGGGIRYLGFWRGTLV